MDTKKINTFGPSEPFLKKMLPRETQFHLLLARYGDYKFSKGIQSVTKDASLQMIQFFNSLRGKCFRLFQSLPVYLKLTPNNNSITVIGYIKKLEAKDNGLWGLFHLNPQCKKIIKKYPLIIAPYWSIRKIHERVFEPIQLIYATCMPDSALVYSKNKLPVPLLKNFNPESLTDKLFPNPAYPCTRRDQVLVKVYEHMQQSGKSYLESWCEVKKNNPPFLS